MRYLLLIAFTSLLSCGQLLFKAAAESSNGRDILSSFLNVWMISAITLYGLGTILWVYILRSTPLSVAYPFAALGFVIVPIAAHFVYGEALGWRFAAGATLVVAGIVLIST